MDESSSSITGTTRGGGSGSGSIQGASSASAFTKFRDTPALSSSKKRRLKKAPVSSPLLPPTKTLKNGTAPRLSQKDHHTKQFKKSGVRTKFLMEALRQEFYQQREENEWLRQLVLQHLPSEKAKTLLASCYDPSAPAATNMMHKIPSSTKEIEELAAKMIPKLDLNSKSDDDDDDMNMNDDDSDCIGF